MNMGQIDISWLMLAGAIVGFMAYRLYSKKKEESQKVLNENAQLIKRLEDLQSLQATVAPKIEINIPGVAHAKIPGDIESFGIKTKSVIDCKKYPVGPGIPSSVITCLQDVMKEGTTRGADIVEVLKGNLDQIKAGSSIYFVLVGEKTQNKLYSFVSAKEEQV